MNDENNTTSLVAVTEVVAAVQKLSELSGRMRIKSLGFSEIDVSHIDNIIDALHELDLHKTTAKDVLETETIKCAAVRHKLMHYPDEINREIHEAVQAARNVNEEAIGRIKIQLEQLSNDIEQLERQIDRVDAESDNMRPDLTAMKEGFDASFAQLNDLLAEKSAQQIRLNDDRESARWANARMVELVEDEVRLAEVMVGEREAHSNDLQRLQEETKSVAQQLRDCTQKEHKTRGEFLAVHSVLQQSTGQLEETTQLNETLEHDNVVLQVQKQDTKRQQAQQQKSMEQLKSNIKVLTAESKSITEEHQTQMVQLKNTAEEVNARTQQQAVMKEKFVAQQSEIKARRETLQVKEEGAKKVQDVSQTLQMAKQDLTARTEDLGRLRQEIVDMDGRQAELKDAERAEKEGWVNPSELLESGSQHLVQFMESRQDPKDPPGSPGGPSLPAASVMEIQDTIELHRRRRQQRETRQAKAKKPELFRRATEFDLNSVLAYNRQIADLKENVGQARGERMTVQAASEKLQAAIGEFNASESAEAKAINGQIDSLKHEKISLDEEQNRLLASTRADEARRAGLAEQLASGRRQLDETRATREAEARRLLSDTERLREARAAKAAELAELTPKFDDFRVFFERSTGEYETLKRSLVTLKGRKTGLEDSSRRADREIGRLGVEIAGMRRDKERRLAESGRQLDDMAVDRVSTESEIYVLACKLDTVVRENARLQDGIERLDREMRSMQSTWEWALPARARLGEQRAREARQFLAGRLRDSAMEAEFHDHDARLLAALAVIIGDTEARRAVLEAVTGGLGAELDYLGEFLRTSSDRQGE